jgi:acetyl-CoA acyltransferase 1
MKVQSLSLVRDLTAAFASQSVYCIQKIGIDPKKVNPNGGAIAIGHPLGATGGRLIATLVAQLGESGGKLGVTSMCASTGQGMATLIVRE